MVDVRWVGGLTTSPCQNPETFSLPVITTDVRWFLGMSQDARVIGSFFHTLSGVLALVSVFSIPHAASLRPLFFVWQIFSCSILSKRLSLFVLFRSCTCISCLLSCSLDACSRNIVSESHTARSTQCNYHLTPGSVTLF